MWSLIVGAILLVISATVNAKVAVLPHDVYPGFQVMHFQGSKRHASNYRLLETGYSKYFTVLEDGMMITTSDLTPLVNRSVNLIVLEHLLNGTQTHDVHIFVINRGNMLTFSTEELGHGKVRENSQPGTVVDGFPLLHADGNFPVHYVIQSDDYAFALMETTGATIGYNLTLKDPNQKVQVVTAKTIDRELKHTYKVNINAYDGSFISTAKINGVVTIIDENDNSPLFDKEEYIFEVRPTNIKTLEKDGVPKWRRFETVGKVSAKDADGDKVAYKLITPTNLLIIIPQTGELVLVDEPEATIDKDSEVEVMIEAHDIRTPSKGTLRPARVVVRFLTTDFYEMVEENDLDMEEEVPQVHHIQKRRVTRAVRPTKKVEFWESEGDVKGKTVFSLEKETEKETYKIRDENRWVTVEENGAVKVKEKWDYEALGLEKTIDFWVTINNANTDNQRVIINLKDVNDEPPYFINKPLPMQAVVQLNAPPNTHVFTLQARDPDTDHNIHYFIVRDRTGGRFEVDERSGVVRTRGADVFQLDMEYVLYVKAEDQNGRIDEKHYQSTPEERLSIVGGKRAPQFYLTNYETEIPENQKKDTDIISVKAKSFADREIRYTLKAQSQGAAGTFNIGPTSGIVKLAKELDFEDVRQPHVYTLVVTATEDSGGFSTSVELTIRVTDVNDNAPKFELPDYQAHNVDEDIPLGTSILKVKATDADSGANADIEYHVSDDHFSVDSSGLIVNNKQLDADNNNAYYEFVVEAKDKGVPSKAGTATVRIYTKNKNDEEPKFSQQVYTPNVDENAGPNTLVTTVVASDKDGDNVRFGFVGGTTSSGQFVIEEITGVIRLQGDKISLERDKYELNVTAMDDGACCPDGKNNIHTSTAVVVVFITDVNDNKPVFKDCGSYSPKVEEGAPNGSPVIKVQATDEDKGVNGQVKYSIVQQPNQKANKFTVDEETGQVSTNKVFDREGDDGKFVSVTVKATDQGEPSLEGVCSFTVEITDVNDNPPLFDRQKYVENVKQDASIGTNILRVSASDEDADNNGAIVYSLSSPNNGQDLEYFEIQSESGWIVLKKALDRDRYRLKVRASDKGTSVLYADVDVELDVVDRNNKPPLWDQNVYGPIHIKENVTVGTVVTSVKASSGIEHNPTVFYHLMPGSTAQTNKYHTFYLQQRSETSFKDNVTWADIKVNHPLDYESIKEYNLTIRVENNGAQQLASEATIHIVLEDVNDEIPLFTEGEQETVLEGEPIGSKVTQVNAIDKDGTAPNNQVTYYIVNSDRNEGKDYFEINRETGEIFTKVIFDREKQGAYALEVEARDGAPSARPNTNGQPNSGK
ncbi:neural-cadherin-like isoform X3 [Chelonus insularis]|uniref:neural-cadherin-like isoform X3 n=1 Tax=Chelonus insularis TaxID=460826 RepID=UPI0015893ABE|nr:neural-cadherin-like isoform X3 [Chelonus insularis]